MITGCSSYILDSIPLPVRLPNQERKIAESSIQSSSLKLDLHTCDRRVYTLLVVSHWHRNIKEVCFSNMSHRNEEGRPFCVCLLDF